MNFKKVNWYAFIIIGLSAVSSILITIGQVEFGWIWKYDFALKYSPFNVDMNDETIVSLVSVILSWVMFLLSVLTLFAEKSGSRTGLFVPILVLHIFAFIISSTVSNTYEFGYKPILFSFLALATSVAGDASWYGVSDSKDPNEKKKDKKKALAKQQQALAKQQHAQATAPQSFEKTPEELELEKQIRIAKLKNEYKQLTKDDEKGE